MCNVWNPITIHSIEYYLKYKDTIWLCCDNKDCLSIYIISFTHVLSHCHRKSIDILSCYSLWKDLIVSLFIAIWCNGSTTDFGSVSQGSNPCVATNISVYLIISVISYVNSYS